MEAATAVCPAFHRNGRPLFICWVIFASVVNPAVKIECELPSFGSRFILAQPEVHCLVEPKPRSGKCWDWPWAIEVICPRVPAAGEEAAVLQPSNFLKSLVVD